MTIQSGSFDNLDLLPQRQLNIGSLVPAVLWHRLAQDNGESLKIGAFHRLNGVVVQMRIYGPANPKVLNELAQNAPSVMAIAYNTLFAYLVNSLTKVGALICDLSMNHLTAIFPVDGEARAGYIYGSVIGVEKAISALTGKTPPGYPDIHWHVSAGISFGQINIAILGNDFVGQKNAILGGSGKMQAEDALELTRQGQIVVHRNIWKRLTVTPEGEWLSEDYFLAQASFANSTMGEAYDPTHFALPQSSQGTPPVSSMQTNRLAAFVDARLRTRPPFAQFQKGTYAEKVCVVNLRLSGLSLIGRNDLPRWQEVLEHIFEIASRYGGLINHVVTEMGIGEVRIIFGLPQNQDFVERRAARCALALNRALIPLNVPAQIGIASSNAFAALLGTRFYSNYVVVAPAIDQAKLLAERAEAREVLGATPIQEATDDLFTWREQNFRLADNVVFALAGEVSLGTGLAVRHQVTLDQIVVGRLLEREKIEKHVERAQNGDGHLLIVDGAGGYGRSTLIDLIIHKWIEQKGTGFVSLGPTYSPSSPYSLWIPIWRSIFDLELDDSARQKRNKLAQVFSRILPDADGGVPIFGNLLGLDIQEDFSLDYLLPEARQRRVFDATLATLGQLADITPILIVFEHTEYSDELSLKLLHALANELKHKPVLFCVEDRRNPSHSLSRTFPQAEVLTTQPLTSVEAWLLLNERLPNLDIPYSFRTIIEKQMGDGRDRQPKFPPSKISSLITILEHEFLINDGNKWKFKPQFTAQDLPDDELEAVGRMLLTVLSETERKLITHAAVAGIEFPHHASWLADEKSKSSTLVEIERLESLGLLQRYLDSGAEERWSRFRHESVREFLYARLDNDERSHLHKSIMKWQHKHMPGRAGASVIAAHAERMGDSSAAVKAYLEAAEFAADWGATSESMQHLLAAERHLARAKTPDPQLMLQLSLTRANLHLAHQQIQAGMTEADNALNYAARASDTIGKAKSLLYRARFAQLLNDHETMLQATERAYKFAEMADHPPILTETAWLRAKALMFNQKRREAVRLLLNVLDHHALDDNELQLEMRLDMIRILLADNQRERAYEHIQRVQKQIPNLDNPVMLHQIMSQVGQVNLLYGNSQTALNALERALALPPPPQMGMTPLAQVLLNHGVALCYAGRYMDAEPIYEAAIDYYQDDNLATDIGYVKLVRAYELYCDQENWINVEETLAELPTVDFTNTSYEDEVPYLISLIKCRKASSSRDHETVQSEIDSLLSLADSTAKRWYMPVICLMMVDVLTWQDDLDEALKWAYKGLGAVGIQGDLRMLVPLYTNLAKVMLLQGNHPEESVRDALDRALNSGRAHGRRLHLAHTLLLWGHYTYENSQRFSTRAKANRHIFEAEQYYSEMGIQKPEKVAKFLTAKNVLTPVS